MHSIFMLLLAAVAAFGEEHRSCIEKINQLKALKSQRTSSLERTAAFVATGNWWSFGRSDEEKRFDEKIRVLELEVKSYR